MVHGSGVRMRNEECVMRNGGAAHKLYSAANIEKR